MASVKKHRSTDRERNSGRMKKRKITNYVPKIIKVAIIYKFVLKEKEEKHNDLEIKENELRYKREVKMIRVILH